MSIITFPNTIELVETAAATIIALIQEAIHQRDICHLALSGGSTPRPVYEQWTEEPFASHIPWEKVHIWWADERCVPPSDTESNFRLASDAFLSQLPILPEHIHRVRGELDPEEAATEYAQQLHNAAPNKALWPRLDIAILGMGADGHTASLFPGPISDDELTRPTIAVTADYDGRPANRVTLTPLLLNSARHVIFLATGSRKANPLTHVLQIEQPDLETYPAARIRPQAGIVTWFVDKVAASQLNQ